MTITTLPVTIGIGAGTAYSAELRPTLRVPKMHIQFIRKNWDDLNPIPVVTGITNALPAVVTVDDGSLLVTGQTVAMTTNMTSLDGMEWAITKLTDNTFELDGSDSSLDPAYVSGSFTLPTESFTVTVQGSLNGTDWVDLVASAVDPTKTLDADIWFYMRVKVDYTAGSGGNGETYEAIFQEVPHGA